MRGLNDTQSCMFSYFSPEQRVPANHPLREIKKLADEVLQGLSGEFDLMYSQTGRPSVPPERLLKAQLLIAFYTVRSDRLFCEMLDYNFLFRWFLDMNLEEPSLDATTFTKNRERLLEHRAAEKFLAAIVGLAQREGLLSQDHFTVDGTLIEAWASMKSFRPKGEAPSARPTDDDDKGNPSVNFKGEKRRNETHQSTTDPEARLMRKSRGQEAKLSFGGHLLMENRHGLLLDIEVAAADGKAEREAALAMVDKRKRKPKTLGGDKGYDTKEFVAELRARKITPHVAANTERKGGSAIDGRTTRHEGYTISQRLRKRVEEIFGWLKTIGGLDRTRFKGCARTQLQARLTGAAYNLLRMAKLLHKETVPA